MRIVTDKANPWNDDKEHISIPLHRYGDTFFIYEVTEENSGNEFPQRLDGATYGEIRFILKNEYAMSVLSARLTEIALTLQATLSGLDEKKRLERQEERSDEDGQTV